MSKMDLLISKYTPIVVIILFAAGITIATLCTSYLWGACNG